jgi:hypothetical protein
MSWGWVGLIFWIVSPTIFYDDSICYVGLRFFFAAMMRLYQKNYQSKYPLFLVIISGCLLSLMIGFTAAHIKTDFVHTPMVERETRPVMVEGLIKHREDQEGKKGTLLFLSDLKIETGKAIKHPVKSELLSDKKAKFAQGTGSSFLQN